MSEIFPPNKTVFNKNLRQLAKTYPELSQKLQASEMPLNQKVITAKNGSPTLIATQNEAEISIHSRYNPEREAYRWAEALGEDWDLLILYGLGLGYHLLAVQELYPEKEIILIEQTSERLFQAMHYLDLTAIFNNLYLVIEEMPETAANKVGQLIFTKSNKRQLIRGLPGCENICQEYWPLLLKKINEIILAFRSNLATEITFQTQWVKNFRDNLQSYFNSPGINTLFNSFTNVPIIIAASGPSLEKNMHLLPKVRGKALVLAAGSAIGPLLKNDIIPDLLISIDPSELNYKHFKDIDTSKVRLAFTSTIYSQIVAEYQGPKFSFGMNTFPFDKWISDTIQEQKGILASGSTVAVTCFDLAIKLGGNPIVFIGQDLAYTDLRSHAEGNINYKEVSKGLNGMFEVEGINGKVHTIRNFLVMKTHLENWIKQLGQGRVIIDATEGGAIIAGTQIMTLSDVVNKYCQRDVAIETILEERLQIHSGLSSVQQAQLLDSFQKLRDDIKLINEALTNVKEKADLLKAESNWNITESQLNKLDRYIKSWERQVARTDFVRYFANPMLGNKLKVFTINVGNKIINAQTIEDKAQQIIEGYLSWFEMINQAADFFANEILDQLEEELS